MNSNNNSRVRIPEQLIGSGSGLANMHPEQYFIDAIGDKILYYNSLGLSSEEISLKLSTPQLPLSISKINTFIMLAKRKIWYQLTGEVERDDETLTNKISSAVYYARANS